MGKRSSSDHTTEGRPATIAHVVVSLGIGGLERVVIDLIKRIDRRRFRPVLCCVEREPEWVREVEESCDVVAFFRKKPGVAYRMPFRVARFLRAERVDIVHCHNFGAFVYGSLGSKIARCRGTIYTVHGPEMPCKKRQVFYQRLPLVDHVVAVSEHMRREALEKIGLDPDRVTTIANGIDTEKYTGAPANGEMRSQLGVTGDAPLFGIVGRLTPEKDHETLLRAFARVVQGHAKATLLIVGDGALQRDLEGRAADLGLGSSVRFLGSRRDIPEILSVLDVFVLPSRQEGLPVALLEAMAANLPVVATTVGGIPDVVVDGVTGRLVAPGDVEKLSEAMVQLLVAPDAARSMGHRGRARVMERFDVGRMIREYEVLYARVGGS